VADSGDCWQWHDSAVMTGAAIAVTMVTAGGRYGFLGKWQDKHHLISSPNRTHQHYSKQIMISDQCDFRPAN
jgi:hypothetical protein